MNRTEIALNSFKWMDYTNPNKEVLGQLADALGLDRHVLFNCLDSDYLPHMESYGATHFLIIRLMEPESELSADSVQELTTKIAIFINPEQMVTIHRLPLREVSEVQNRVNNISNKEIAAQKIVSFFFEQASLGFNEPLTDLESKLQDLEENLFNKQKSKTFLQDGFYLKRKASAFKKVLKLTLDLMNKLITESDYSPEQFQQSKDRLERALFYAEDVYDNIQSLLSLHMAIESQNTNEASFRTNEIMRVLTVLTIFFLPLNFLAGVFGMNFQYIPLLTNPVGFWISIVMMLLVSVFLSFYLYKQGWLMRPGTRIRKNQNE